MCLANHLLILYVLLEEILNKPMKKTILSIFGMMTLAASSFSQTQTVDPQNVREGESVEYCVTHKKEADLLQNPDYVAAKAQDNITREQEVINGVNQPEATVYYIPVVFHLLHNNGPENISDEQILDALAVLNRDYALQNADANNVHADFNASTPGATVIPANVEIQFRLATISPKNNYSECFSGITRTVSPLTVDLGQNSSGQDLDNVDGFDQVQAIINGNDVFNGAWPGDRYLNVFICSSIGGAAGYTYRPNSNFPSTNMYNGIWVLHNYLGSIGTSSTYTSRTLTHEVGHWLNLPHPWGSTNNPGLAANCNSDDSDDSPLITDTPNTRGSTSCNLNENFCGPRANVENYMDYSYCSKMFTPRQVVAMRSAVNSNVANRDNLITTANLNLVGANGNLTLCKAEFSADKTTICVNDQVTFDDQTYSTANGWTWTFTGGTPATSTAQNPVVTYSTPGIYNVTLQATDGTNADTEAKTSYIRVLPDGATLPFLESFESFSTLTNVNEWEIFNPSGNGFELTTTAGHTGTKSAKLSNYNQPAGNTDELISAPVDLSGLTSADAITLSFRYAYRKRSSGNDEWLKVFVSNDCGAGWAQRKTIHGSLLSNVVVSSAFTPASQADWETVHMTNVTSSYFTDNFRYKFEFESDGGNNFYLDDINIYEGAPSDVLVANVLENGATIEGLSVYPNPADNELNVRFSIANAENAYLTIQDVSGKTVQNNFVKANSGANLVMMNTSSLAQGMYFLQVRVGTTNQTLQFVVK